MRENRGARGRSDVVWRPQYTQLAPGPGRTRAEVASHQRARIHGAMIELVAEHGYAGVTVSGLVRRARVSSRTFYEHFDDKDECFMATYDSARDAAGLWQLHDHHLAHTVVRARIRSARDTLQLFRDRLRPRRRGLRQPAAIRALADRGLDRSAGGIVHSV